jgi:hypothetical protein
MVVNGDIDESQESLISDTKKYGSTSQEACSDSSHDDDEDESYTENGIHLKPLHCWDIVCILSNAFAYGCILTTLFLITLPLECERIQREHPTMPKSVSLGVFVAIAGITQLISPLAGMLSDSYKPPTNDLGQRLPYLVLGAILTVIGLLCQYAFSERSFWIRFSFAFFLHMIGLNIIYSMMIALIPDQVPSLKQESPMERLRFCWLPDRSLDLHSFIPFCHGTFKACMDSTRVLSFLQPYYLAAMPMTGMWYYRKNVEVTISCHHFRRPDIQ